MGVINRGGDHVTRSQLSVPPVAATQFTPCFPVDLRMPYAEHPIVLEAVS